MIGQHWDQEAVASRLEEAVDVLARLPEERAPGCYDLWPSRVECHAEAAGRQQPCPRRSTGWMRRSAGCAGSSPKSGAGLATSRGLAVEADHPPARHRPHHGLAPLDHALLKIATRLNAAAEQNRPDIKPLNRSGRFCATDALTSRGLGARPFPRTR